MYTVTLQVSILEPTDALVLSALICSALATTTSGTMRVHSVVVEEADAS
jgi:hypothetical protein